MTCLTPATLPTVPPSHLMSMKSALVWLEPKLKKIRRMRKEMSQQPPAGSCRRRRKWMMRVRILWMKSIWLFPVTMTCLTPATLPTVPPSHLMSMKSALVWLEPKLKKIRRMRKEMSQQPPAGSCRRRRKWMTRVRILWMKSIWLFPVTMTCLTPATLPTVPPSHLMSMKSALVWLEPKLKKIRRMRKEMSQQPPGNWELQEEEEMDDACQDSLDEKYLALSSHHDLSDSCHPPDSPTLPSDEHEICSRLVGAQTQKDQKDEERDEPTAPSWELQEEEEMDDACQDSLDEKYLALSSHHDLSDSCHPPDSPTIPSDEHEICSRLDGAQSHEDEEYVEEREPLSKMNDQGRVKDREFEFLIRLQARELTQLRLKTREGRELSLLLNQNLKELLGRSDLNNLRGQAFQEQLAEGCRLSQALVSKLGPENHEEEAEEQLGSLTPRKYHFLIHDHARKLTRIRQTLREGRELSVLLHQDLRDLLTHSDIGRDWGQGFQEQLAEGSRLAEHLVRKLSPENLEDDDEEEEQESLSPSLERELLEKEIVNEILPDPSGEQNSTPSSPHDLSASGEPLRSTAFPCDEPQVRLTLEAATPSWEACQQGPLSGNLSFQRTEMQTSQAQLEPSSWGSNYLGLQLDQFHCGDGKATLGLSFTTWSCAANSVSANRGSLFQELGLDASLRMKTPPTLKGDALECSDASKQGCQVIGHIDASSVIQQRILKRKLRLSKWRLACRFPGLQA
ncbi:neuroblastoma breakpoint family member 6-like [Equus caballus]|uniref:neuroblastoma breakpoint family member 6-like n=1 Tax=Equus caballus TaxID=9796 RepID=UPI0038B3F831